jgi:glucose-1-phosphate cytidylyltransferase
MKVVLFCGGLGMRLRDYDENIPKPMVPIGYRPILWHVMKYYASFGHKDFILCLGYHADVIKNYFRSYDECVSNDFVLSEGGRKLELLQSDIGDWRITFVDTGVSSSIGQRLEVVEPHLAGEREFFANYSDGLTDLPLSAQLEHFQRHDRIASFLCVKPHLSYHFVVSRNGGQVTSIQDIGQTGLRINGGYFIFKTEIFDYLRNREELVTEAFQHLLSENQLLAYRYDGFWESMDTFKDKQRLDDMYARGDAPWEVWKRAAPVDVPRDAEVIAQVPFGLPRGRRRALGPH